MVPVESRQVEFLRARALGGPFRPENEAHEQRKPRRPHSNNGTPA
jgi:hypothetical protein